MDITKNKGHSWWYLQPCLQFLQQDERMLGFLPGKKVNHSFFPQN